MVSDVHERLLMGLRIRIKTFACARWRALILASTRCLVSPSLRSLFMALRRESATKARRDAHGRRLVRVLRM